MHQALERRYKRVLAGEGKLPDILLIEGVHIVPKAPYRLKTLDVVSIQVSGALPEAQVMGQFPVEPGGVVNLGIDYGAVPVAGMTVKEAEAALRSIEAKIAADQKTLLGIGDGDPVESARLEREHAVERARVGVRRSEQGGCDPVGIGLLRRGVGGEATVGPDRGSLRGEEADRGPQGRIIPTEMPGW